MKCVLFILASCLPRGPEQGSAIAIAWLAWRLYCSSFTYNAVSPTAQQKLVCTNTMVAR